MNIFRLIGDLLHMASLCIFLFVVAKRRNGAGISARSQELFLVVFCCRYLDLFTTFYSLYNSLLKVVYIATTALIVYCLRYVEPTCSTYSRKLDLESISTKQMVVPSFIIAFIVHFFGSMPYGFDWIELLWTFSIVLETVAMLPQLFMFRKNRNTNSLIQVAIALLGSYRLFYIFNWVYRSYHEPHYRHHYLVYIAGVAQVLVYGDFVAFHSSKLCGGVQPENEHEVALQDYSTGLDRGTKQSGDSRMDPLLARDDAEDDAERIESRTQDDGDVQSGGRPQQGQNEGDGSEPGSPKQDGAVLQIV